LGRVVIKEKIQNEALPKYLTLSLTKDHKVSKGHSSVTNEMLQAQSFESHPRNGGLESLALKTSHLNIGGVGNKSHTAGKSMEPAKSILARKQQLPKVDNLDVRRSPRLLAKRVRSAVDEASFDLI